MATSDVTIHGAGIFGLSVAWACLLRGARVRVIDPAGVAGGASGGIVGALAPHTPENWNEKKAFQLASLLAAQPFWAGVDAASGMTSGYARSGRLQPLPDASAAQHAIVRAQNAKTLWGGYATWTVVDTPASGWAPISPTGQVIFDTLSAHIHPAQACASLAAAITARGGEIIRSGQDRGKIVWATGWTGLRDLAQALNRPVGGGVKGQAVLLRHRAPSDAPQIFADGLHIIPHADGTVAIGSTTEREFDDPTATDGRCDALVEKATEVLPILKGAAVLRRWAGVRPRAKSRAPILGPLPNCPGHYIANGGFKIGFGMAPEVARVMAELVLDGRDRIPDAFRVDVNL